jgi:hypothetical protein
LWQIRPRGKKMREMTRRGLLKISVLVLCSVFFLLMARQAMVHTPDKPVDAHGTRPVRIVDESSGMPIEGAFLTSGNEIGRTDENGVGYVKLDGNKSQGEVKIGVRARGYQRKEETIALPQEFRPSLCTPEGIYLSLNEVLLEDPEEFSRTPQELKLKTFTPKALYLSFYGIGDRRLREAALKLIEETELNALVIDVKGDKGMIPYPSSIPMASAVGAQKIITVRDMKGLLTSFREKGIYTIARIVVFKDNLLAEKMPHLAVRTQNGQVWRDREGLAWVDPFKKEVWDYNVAIAMEAAQQGFDEIQFDYVRFPDASAPQFSMANTQENRLQAVVGFLKEARDKLLPYNTFLSADIFGYVCWNVNDTLIGQTLDDFLPHVDYLAPMLYPSGFQYGIPGYRIPVTNPYEIVHLTLKKAQERTMVSPLRFRPWLQAFRDYAFDRRSFEEKEIKDQIKAAEKFGSHGWMLWNPRNSYSANGLKREEPAKVALRTETE